MGRWRHFAYRAPLSRFPRRTAALPLQVVMLKHGVCAKQFGEMFTAFCRVKETLKKSVA